MPSKIVATAEYVSLLESKYVGLKIPAYKLRKWFSEDKQVFFDCESSAKESCVKEVMTRLDLRAFLVYLIIRDSATESYGFMDVNFRNLGTESLEHFISRYHQQLEAMTKLSLQTAGEEYVVCLGHGYE